MEFKAPSGAKVVINPADFRDAMSLKSAIAKEISIADFNIDLNALSNEADVSELIKLFLSLDASENVYDKVFACLARCTRNGERITESTFDDVDAREDYYEIAFNCIKENLNPFLKGLRSRLSQLMQMGLANKKESPEQQ